MNLGIALLIAPLAAVPAERSLEDGIGPVLNSLDQTDAARVYEAIRIAAPGGMGRVGDQDVAGVPTETLREVMRRAADRDQIAAEYAHGFPVVREYAAAHFTTPLDGHETWNASIVHLQLKLLARFGDSLIARKCGADTTAEVQQRAGRALQSYERTGRLGTPEIAELDAWLHGDGHRRNPGTTADLIAAILFAVFRDGHADYKSAAGALPVSGSDRKR